MQNLSIIAERIRTARPDSVRHAKQLAPGNIVVKFLAYIDPEGIINHHLTRVAVVRGPAYRIIDDEMLEKGRSNIYMRAEKLPAHTLQEQLPPDLPGLLSVGGMGIEGVDKLSPHLTTNAGLLAVREEVYPEGESLEVGPGLYVNGANDYQTLFQEQFMAVALDSDSRLAGRLPRPWA